MASCGRFDYIRDSEPLVTAIGGSSNSDLNTPAPEWQNLPGYQWNPGFDCTNAGNGQAICTQGGEIDAAAGLYSNTVLATSSNSVYYYGATDASGAYTTAQNACQWCSASGNVTLSQREVVWLKP